MSKQTHTTQPPTSRPGGHQDAPNQPGDLSTAICIALPAPAAQGDHAEAGNLPATLQLLPAGPDIQGIDGRGWTVQDLPALISAQNAAGDIPIDWEHATETAAPKGLPAPAAGWLSGFHDCNGALCANVAWTPRGADAVRNREHRYLSPAFLFDKADVIRLIRSVGLTNRPNLDIAALNRQTPTPETPPMALPAKLATALGVAEDADEQTACNAVTDLYEKLATAQAATPSLDSYVPRADYNTALNRAASAEQTLADSAAKALEADITIAVDAAQAAGKITPATRDYHLAQCRQEGGLERFNDFVTAAVPIVAPSEIEGSPPAAKAPLTASQTALCRQLGIKEEDYSNSLTAITAAQEPAA